MICSHLCRIIPAAALVAGARMINEPHVRPNCQLSSNGLRTLHEGKDSSICNFLEGGCGFPEAFDSNPSAVGAFDLGVQQERTDLRQMLEWQTCLELCMIDRRRGVKL